MNHCRTYPDCGERCDCTERLIGANESEKENEK